MTFAAVYGDGVVKLEHLLLPEVDEVASQQQHAQVQAILIDNHPRVSDVRGFLIANVMISMISVYLDFHCVSNTSGARRDG